MKNNKNQREKAYKLVCNTTGENLYNRLAQHKSDYKRF